MTRTAKNKVTCNILCAYAPTFRKTMKDPKQARKFYNQLSFIIKKTKKLEVIIIGRDFNAIP